MLYTFITNNNISSNKHSTLKKLFENNTNLLKSIKIDFINSDYFEKLDFNLLQAIVSLDETVQLNFLKINGQKRTLFYEIINRFSKTYYQFPYVNALLTNFNNEKFKALLNSINISELTDNDYLNLSYLLTAKENVLNVQSLKDLRSIDNTINQKIETAKAAHNVEDYKNYMLLKKTNLSLPEARLICQKYCYDLDHFNIDDPMIDVLKTLKRIVLSDSMDDVEQLINRLNINKNSYPDVQTMCQNLYEKDFNSVLFNPNDYEPTFYEGCKLIDAGTKFNMIIRANGAFSSSNGEVPAKEYWVRNIRTALSFSNSLLSNNYLRNVSFFKDADYLIGFSYIPKNCMAECCMGDNATIHARKKTLDVRSFNDDKQIHPNTGDACGQQFRPFSEMIKHGAGEYQELTLERFSYIDGKEERVMPSYVLYFKKDEDFKNDSGFKRALKAAKSFGVPLVTIDVKKVILSEKKEIESLLQAKFSIQNITDAIRRYANLINSFSANKVQHILEETLGIKDVETSVNTMVKNLLTVLEEKNFDKQFYQDLLDELILLNDEKNCIKTGVLVKLKNKYDLSANFKKYADIVYGITYKKHNDKINSQYRFENIEKVCNHIVNNGLELTDAVYDNDNIESIVSTCESEGIPLTQEIISYTWKEFMAFLKRHNTIKELSSYPNEKSIDQFFDLFTNEEIEDLLQPIIDKMASESRVYLMNYIKEKLKEKKLENKFVIPLNEDNNEFDDSSWDFSDWEQWEPENMSKKQ